jgi:starch synthase
MKILICSSEVAPFSKTGGLGDVAGALPPILTALGHDVRVVTPMHSSLDFSRAINLDNPAFALGVPMGHGEEWCAVHETRLPDGNTPVYLLEHQRYFDRPGLYGVGGKDFPDNAERFAFLSRAALQVCKALEWSPDVVHAHDWQTGLMPVLLRAHYAGDPILGGTASVFTIHNVGYQGEFYKEYLPSTGLGWEWFTPNGVEFHDRLNYMKAGIVFADKVSTVSQRYAWEVTTPEEGFGLDGVLRSRTGDLVGIVNGLDYGEWDPSIDSRIPATFDVDDFAGKVICKESLQQEYGLPVRADVPVVGMVTRLAYQKGIDVLAAALPAIMRMDAQFVVLGSGEVWANFVYGDLPNRFPRTAGSFIGFDEARAHRVYAGSDLFLMPSRYEPCGLGQLSAKRYGALPIVRRTGGLAETVTNYSQEDGGGDGFAFDDLTPLAIANTVGWAVSTWYDRPDHFAAMRDRAMRDRFTWERSALKYADLYRWAVEKKNAT